MVDCLRWGCIVLKRSLGRVAKYKILDPLRSSTCDGYIQYGFYVFVISFPSVAKQRQVKPPSKKGLIGPARKKHNTLHER